MYDISPKFTSRPSLRPKDTSVSLSTNEQGLFRLRYHDIRSPVVRCVLSGSLGTFSTTTKMDQSTLLYIHPLLLTLTTDMSLIDCIQNNRRSSHETHVGVGSGSGVLRHTSTHYPTTMENVLRKTLYDSFVT